MAISKWEPDVPAFKCRLIDDIVSFLLYEPVPLFNQKVGDLS